MPQFGASFTHNSRGIIYDTFVKQATGRLNITFKNALAYHDEQIFIEKNGGSRNVRLKKEKGKKSKFWRKKKFFWVSKKRVEMSLDMRQAIKYQTDGGVDWTEREKIETERWVDRKKKRYRGRNRVVERWRDRKMDRWRNVETDRQRIGGTDR
jgi:hypothetical protein